MASSLSAISPSALLQTYPELLFSAAAFTVFFLYRLSRLRTALLVNWPVLGMLPSLLANLNCFHDWIVDLCHEYGCTFFFFGPFFSGMKYLFTADPANVNHIFNVNFVNYPKGHDLFEVFDILGDGIFVADGESWKSQRHKAQILMSKNRFRFFTVKASRDKVEKGLLPLLTLIAEKEEEVDLQDVMLRLTFDLTCSLVLGVDPGSLAVGFPTVGFSKAIDDAMEAIFFRHVAFGCMWKLMRFFRVGTEKKMAKAQEVIDGFVDDIISKRRKIKIGEPDLLTSYLNDNLSQDDKFLRDTAVNLMLAGRDTTGAALAWFFWLLVENPSVEKRVVEELKECRFQSGPSMELEKFVYLHAALCETLRLYPPVPLERKCTLGSEILPSGTEVCPGTEIIVSLYAMGRMEGVWGKDCLKFRPERWISEKGRLRHEPSYKFMSFNSGPRTCLGKDIAFTQMKAIAAAVVWNFHVELVKGHVVEPKLSIILHMKNGMMVRLRKRAYTLCGDTASNRAAQQATACR